VFYFDKLLWHYAKMLFQCVSKTISDSWWHGAVIWSDKCVPLSLEVIILSFLLLCFLSLMHKSFIPFLKKTRFYKLVKLEQHEISNLRGVTILKLIIFLPIAMIYLIFIIALSWFLADLILNYIGWTADMRFYLF